jgi:hypothetical protein
MTTDKFSAIERCIEAVERLPIPLFNQVKCDHYAGLLALITQDRAELAAARGREAKYREALNNIIENRVADGGPCTDWGKRPCGCSECVAREAIACTKIGGDAT